MSKRKTTEEFIREAKTIHRDKYNYSKVDYINNSTKVCIICPEHGEFWQNPDKHLLGQGCPKCCNTKKGTTETFIQKARELHGDIYDYSKVEYINNKIKVCIICPEHGEYYQTPHNHLKGQGCPKCGKLINKPLKYTTETFIQKAKEIHGDKYDYSKTVYKDMNTKVIITCPKHGDFEQVPFSHLYGMECKKCSHEKQGIEKRLSTAEFIKRAKEIHGDKYDYSKVKYSTSKEKVCIICPKHGEFWQTPDKHLFGECGCPKCTDISSKAETEIYEYIKSIINNDIIQHDREILNGKEIDIYIPSLKIGIEYNGLYWHTEKRCDKNFHLSKTESANTKGIKLIQIFEDEYLNHKDIVFSKISHLLGENNILPLIGARKCSIKEITVKESKEFLNKNHIQGFGNGTIHLGAYYKKTLIAVMSFKKENIKDKWELTRFATDNNYRCPGIGGKLFSYFIKNNNPEEIKSFADRRWTINENSNLYIKLGFKLDKTLAPDYRYYKAEDGPIRQHKFKFRKDTLNKKYNLPLSLTEKEMTEKLGYTKIYDCGLFKYIWKRDTI